MSNSKDKSKELTQEQLDKVAGGHGPGAHNPTSSSSSGGFRPPHRPPVVHHTSSSTSSSSFRS